ncbi:hypothetical protein [Mycoplasma leonicaptivi]|uniref:hypothetical protein n=1 Tax=Mycoplasma leonicaptivi TaxID=36742 RepID=UPI0004822C23|nr:hypothetical protein [Mycoplasma leonicaptivi]
MLLREFTQNNLRFQNKLKLVKDFALTSLILIIISFVLAISIIIVAAVSILNGSVNGIIATGGLGITLLIFNIIATIVIFILAILKVVYMSSYKDKGNQFNQIWTFSIVLLSLVVAGFIFSWIPVAGQFISLILSIVQIVFIVLIFVKTNNILKQDVFIIEEN